ncbi:MAG: protein phosphatase [Flavobacterium sp.]|nr:MAG: protein phosphatase [Flavobacterium sp.]
MSTKKKVLVTALLIAVAAGAYKIYDVYFNYRFMTITDGKVYKSGVIPPDKIADFVKNYHIKSIVDLRGPVDADTINNPEKKSEIWAEKEATSKIPGLNYYNIPSHQVPNKQTLNKFYKVIDNPANYPLLIHCYHGIGRAQVYSAIYRIEKENESNEEARSKAAFPVIFSSFDDGTPKGEFLKSYVPRKDSVKVASPSAAK